LLAAVGASSGCGFVGSSIEEPDMKQWAEEWERNERMQREEYEKRREADPSLPPWEESDEGRKRVHGGVI
jgi:hypothetical protein